MLLGDAKVPAVNFQVVRPRSAAMTRYDRALLDRTSLIAAISDRSSSGLRR